MPEAYNLGGMLCRCCMLFALFGAATAEHVSVYARDFRDLMNHDEIIYNTAVYPIVSSCCAIRNSSGVCTKLHPPMTPCGIGGEFCTADGNCTGRNEYLQTVDKCIDTKTDYSKVSDNSFCLGNASIPCPFDVGVIKSISWACYPCEMKYPTGATCGTTNASVFDSNGCQSSMVVSTGGPSTKTPCQSTGDERTHVSSSCAGIYINGNRMETAGERRDPFTFIYNEACIADEYIGCDDGLPCKTRSGANGTCFHGAGCLGDNCTTKIETCSFGTCITGVGFDDNGCFACGTAMPDGTNGCAGIYGKSVCIGGTCYSEVSGNGGIVPIQFCADESNFGPGTGYMKMVNGSCIPCYNTESYDSKSQYWSPTRACTMCTRYTVPDNSVCSVVQTFTDSNGCALYVSEYYPAGTACLGSGTCDGSGSCKISDVETNGTAGTLGGSESSSDDLQTGSSSSSIPTEDDASVSSSSSSSSSSSEEIVCDTGMACKTRTGLYGSYSDDCSCVQCETQDCSKNPGFGTCSSYEIVVPDSGCVRCDLVDREAEFYGCGDSGDHWCVNGSCVEKDHITSQVLPLTNTQTCIDATTLPVQCSLSSSVSSTAGAFGSYYGTGYYCSALLETACIECRGFNSSSSTKYASRGVCVACDATAEYSYEVVSASVATRLCASMVFDGYDESWCPKFAIVDNAEGSACYNSAAESAGSCSNASGTFVCVPCVIASETDCSDACYTYAGPGTGEACGSCVPNYSDAYYVADSETGRLAVDKCVSAICTITSDGSISAETSNACDQYASCASCACDQATGVITVNSIADVGTACVRASGVGVCASNGTCTAVGPECGAGTCSDAWYYTFDALALDGTCTHVEGVSCPTLVTTNTSAKNPCDDGDAETWDLCFGDISASLLPTCMSVRVAKPENTEAVKYVRARLIAAGKVLSTMNATLWGILGGPSVIPTDSSARDAVYLSVGRAASAYYVSETVSVTQFAAAMAGACSSETVSLCENESKMCTPVVNSCGTDIDVVGTCVSYKMKPCSDSSSAACNSTAVANLPSRTDNCVVARPEFACRNASASQWSPVRSVTQVAYAHPARFLPAAVCGPSGCGSYNSTAFDCDANPCTIEKLASGTAFSDGSSPWWCPTGKKCSSVPASGTAACVAIGSAADGTPCPRGACRSGVCTRKYYASEWKEVSSLWSDAVSVTPQTSLAIGIKVVVGGVEAVYPATGILYATLPISCPAAGSRASSAPIAAFVPESASYGLGYTACALVADLNYVFVTNTTSVIGKQRGSLIDDLDAASKATDVGSFARFGKAVDGTISRHVNSNESMACRKTLTVVCDIAAYADASEVAPLASTVIVRGMRTCTSDAHCSSGGGICIEGACENSIVAPNATETLLRIARATGALCSTQCFGADSSSCAGDGTLISEYRAALGLWAADPACAACGACLWSNYSALYTTKTGSCLHASSVCATRAASNPCTRESSCVTHNGTCADVSIQCPTDFNPCTDSVCDPTASSAYGHYGACKSTSATGTRYNDGGCMSYVCKNGKSVSSKPANVGGNCTGTLSFWIFDYFFSVLPVATYSGKCSSSGSCSSLSSVNIDVQ